MPEEGSTHPRWKGGRYKCRGYWMVKISIGKYRLEHRVVMEKKIQRSLKRLEAVHHINGDKLDNRIENLQLMTISNHTKHHWDTGELRDSHIVRPSSNCHPSREHYANGLCELCYM